MIYTHPYLDKYASFPHSLLVKGEVMHERKRGNDFKTKKITPSC